MISKSILFSGPVNSENFFFASLKIEPQDILSHEDNCTFLSFRRNGALTGTVSGDFNRSVDLFLFDIDEPILHQRFVEASMQGIRIAMPDESTAEPWVYLLWEKGGVHPVRMIEGDDHFVISAHL